MGKNRTIQDIFVVSFGNIVALVANIIIGFILPLILDIENYGYYKTYTLYISYTGLLHFGFVDGILLLFAGKNYDELNREKFRLYTKFFVILESVFGVIGVAGAVAFLNGQMRVIMALVSLNLIWSNLILYFQYISQATSRFKEFAVCKIINAVSTIALVAVLFFIWKKYSNSSLLTAEFYIVASQIISVGLLGWYFVTYRNITFGKKEAFVNEKNTILLILKKGFVLTIAYEVSRLVLVMDRQFVSALFDIETYARYAFAYNILSCVTALITGISTVMFPKLKRMSHDEAMKFFPKGMALITVLVCFAQLGYYPIRHIVMWLLPHYADSLEYFRIVFPVLALTSCITIIVFTFYKILDKNNVFFLVCAVSLVFAFLANVVAYCIWKTPASISWASLISTVFWYLISVLFLSKNYHVQWLKNFAYAMCMVCAFYLTTDFITNEFISIATYLLILIVISVFLYKKDMAEMIKSQKHLSNGEGLRS